MLELLAFLTGMGAGLLNHEAGHQLAAALSQDDLRWSGTTWECRADCDAATVGNSGLLVQSLSSELLLNLPETPRKHPFVAGWLVWNIANPVLYTLHHELAGPHGDLKNFSRREARIMESLLVAHAASTALRWSGTVGEIEPFFFAREDGIAFGVAIKW